MPKFHRRVCSLSFRSAAFERLFSGQRDGACLGAGAGVDGFSLVGGSKAHRVSVSNYHLGNSSKCVHAFVCIWFNHAIEINFTYLQ